MTREEVDAFFAASNKRLPVPPAWRSSSRQNEFRARLQVEVGGTISPVEVEIVIQAQQMDSIVVVLLAPTCIARLCLGKKHFDRTTRTLVFDAHFHPWHMNRPKGQALPNELPAYEILPDPISDRDQAIAWFLNRTGVESPKWLPVKWPDSEALL